MTTDRPLPDSLRRSVDALYEVFAAYDASGGSETFRDLLRPGDGEIRFETMPVREIPGDWVADVILGYSGLRPPISIPWSEIIAPYKRLLPRVLEFMASRPGSSSSFHHLAGGIRSSGWASWGADEKDAVSRFLGEHWASCICRHSIGDCTDILLGIATLADDISPFLDAWAGAGDTRARLNLAGFVARNTEGSERLDDGRVMTTRRESNLVWNDSLADSRWVEVPEAAHSIINWLRSRKVAGSLATLQGETDLTDGEREAVESARAGLELWQYASTLPPENRQVRPAAIEAVQRAADTLYETFACHELPPGPLQVCPCCVDEQVAATTRNTPLRELRGAALREISSSVGSTWGEGAVYKHFVPRLLEAAFFSQTDIFGVDTLLADLGRNGPRTWPEHECEAIRQFLLAAWPATIAEEGFQLEGPDEWLCGIALAGYDLAEFLSLWESDPRPETAGSLAVFIVWNSEQTARVDRSTGEISLSGKCLANDGVLVSPFWSDAPEQMAEVIAWLKSDAVRAKMRDAASNEQAECCSHIRPGDALECLDAITGRLPGERLALLRRGVCDVVLRSAREGSEADIAGILSQFRWGRVTALHLNVADLPLKVVESVDLVAARRLRSQLAEIGGTIEFV
jgi:hypothetical protein